ncbi:MAG: hypothetical protein V7609_3097 [Verrucomicrobiota bacterium]
MKTTFLTCFCSIALALSLFGQAPTPASSPAPQSTLSPAPAIPSPTLAAAIVSPSAAVSATPADDDDDISRDVARKLKRKFGITIDRHHGPTITRHHSNNDDNDMGALIALPIIGIVFSTLFGAPIMIVIAIMFFSYLKSRSLHRTVRMMVEKGQEVPPALFAPPPVMRARSDMRRGVVLVMVGIGVMIFFGAASDWDGGAWALGMIPFLIGAAYLVVWKLEGRKDKVPPLP